MKTSYYKLLWMIEKKIAPKKVKYDDMIFEWSSDNYKRWDVFDEVHFLSSYLTMDEMLKDEIEILDDDDEEKGLPEKIPFIEIEGKYTSEVSNIELTHKINEIIEYLEKAKRRGMNYGNKLLCSKEKTKPC